MAGTATSEFQRISPTALLIAYLRQLTDIPFATQIAAAAGAEQAALAMMSASGVTLQESQRNAPFVEARYKCILSAIRRLGITQVVEFGSGLAFRGVHFADDQRFSYIDTDLPPIIEEKTRLLEKIPELREQLLRGKVLFQPADISRWEDVDRALGLVEQGGPIALVHEGLLGYLSLEEKGVVADNVRRALEKHGGAWITPDLATRRALAEHARNDPAATRENAAVARLSSRSFADNAFEDDAHIEEFFSRRGFSVEVRPQLDGSFSLSALERLGLAGSYMDPFHPRVWTLTLRSAAGQ